jgi:outer membrane protein/adhesin transport system outer membrane protein
VARRFNPRVVAAEYHERGGRELIDEVRGEELPEVSLNGSASDNWDRTSLNDNSREYTFGARLSFPFYQGGAVAARTRAAGHTASQLRLIEDQTRREVAEGAGQAYDDLITARANIEAYFSAIKAAQVALEGVKQENEVGQRSILDILDAQQELLNAQVNLVKARHDEVVASYNLLSSVGQLTAKNLSLPVTLYDPNAHYDKTRGKWIGYGPE